MQNCHRPQNSLPDIRPSFPEKKNWYSHNTKILMLMVCKQCSKNCPIQRRRAFQITSSSTGTTAHCGLWPVEKDPSIFPICHQLSLSSLNPSSFFPLFDFRNNKFFTVWGCLRHAKPPTRRTRVSLFCLDHHP
jgi:hypothetical protein